MFYAYHIHISSIITNAYMKAVLPYIFLCFTWVTSAIAQSNNEIKAPAISIPDTTDILTTIRNAYSLQNTGGDSSIAILKNALAQSRSVGFTNGIAHALVYLGMANTAKGDEIESLACYLEAIPYAQKCRYDTELMATLYTGMGTPYFRKRDYGQAAYYYYKAQEEVIRNRLQHSVIACHLYVNMGALWVDIQRYDYALKYLLQAERIAVSNKDTVSLIVVYESLGVLYSEQNKIDEGNTYILRAEQLATKKNMLSTRQVALTNIGITLRTQHQPAQAIPYFQEAISLTDDEHAYQHNLGAYYNLAFAYYETNNYSAAKNYALATVKEAEKLGLEEEDLGSAMWMVSDIYQKEKKYEKANYWLNKYVAYTDSMLQHRADSNINKLEINYQLSEKDKELAQKQLLLSKKELQLKNKNILIGSVFGGVLLLSVLLVSFYLIGKHKQHTQTEKIRNLEQGKELGNLKAMLEGEEKERSRLSRELHDGIGGMLAAAKLNLGSIKEQHPELAKIKQINDVIELLNDTAAEVRQTAHNLMPDVLIKNSLQDALLLYCENVNAGCSLNIELQLHGALHEMNKSVELILYRITQELIQNVIKHAKATQAIIQIIQDNGRLNLIVEDNGTGFNVNNSNGAGSQNLQYRVQALQGYISITSAAGKGTSVYIEFDLEKLKHAS